MCDTPNMPSSHIVYPSLGDKLHHLPSLGSKALPERFRIALDLRKSNCNPTCISLFYSNTNLFMAQIQDPKSYTI